MPSRIPVRIADKDFPSLNQARIHYRDILHRYQPGQSVNDQDRQDVEQLMSCSGFELLNRAEPHSIRVVQGYYGRSCFARCCAGGNSISIARSVRLCLMRDRDSTTVEVERHLTDPDPVER